MALIGDLSEAELATLTSTVAGRITGSILGREGAGGTVTVEIAGASVAFLVAVAPKTPEAIGREAMIRLAGWLFGNRPHTVEHEFTDPSGSTTKLRFNNSAATASGFRSSGASALVSRFIVRRAGPVG